MSPSSRPLIPYHELVAHTMENPAIVRLVSDEHYVSLPLPTLRWRSDAVASFASPWVKDALNPRPPGDPAQWWLLDAHSGRLRLFADMDVMAFASERLPDASHLDRNVGPSSGQEKESVERVLQRIQVIKDLIGELAPAFFGGDDALAEKRATLRSELVRHLPRNLVPWSQAFAPDFWAWLS